MVGLSREPVFGGSLPAPGQPRKLTTSASGGRQAGCDVPDAGLSGGRQNFLRPWLEFWFRSSGIVKYCETASLRVRAECATPKIKVGVLGVLNRLDFSG